VGSARAHPSARALATRLVFPLTAVGVFLVSLDVSIANAILPAIGVSFRDASRAGLAWVITAYAIAFAAALVPAGRLADRAGRRRVFTGGLGIFALGSAICGAAPGLAVMIAGRILQGIGAAAAQPASLGLLLAGTDPGRRAVYTARWYGAGAVGIGLGPLLGGLASDTAGWRWAFLINLPIVALAVALAPEALDETPRHPGRRLPDPVGAMLLALAAATLALGISELTGWGATDVRSLAALGSGAILSVAFLARSRRAAEPLLDLELFGSRRVAVVTAVTLLYSAGFFGLLFSFILFQTSIWHMTTIQAGLGITPMAVLAMGLSTHVGRLSDSTGFAVPLAAGAALIAAGLTLQALTAGGDSFEPSWVACVLVTGLGIGLCYPLLGAAAVHGLAAGHLAAATALNQCARQLGAALGVAATVAAIGSSGEAGTSRFHAAWALCAAFALTAALGAWTLRRDERGACARP
jgi:EmrB/QacA subfamily drug resistance transporter